MSKKRIRSTSSSAKPRKPRAAKPHARPEAVAGFTYEQARANKVIRFVESFCQMSKGEWAGRPMQLLEWQKRDIIEPLFGWVDAEKRRRYRTAAIFTPKKNGKSTLLSALALYLTVADGEPGAEVISAASDRAQAGIIALTAFVSPYRRDRDAVRRLLAPGDFVEVYVRAPLEVCEGRDPKGLYKKARAGEIKGFTGIDDPYEEPVAPELVVDSAARRPDELAAEVIAWLERNGKIPAR